MGRRARCKYEDCKRERRYIIGVRQENETIELTPVCGTHDRFIGRHNLMDCGWTLEEAIKFERDPEIVISTNGRSAVRNLKESRFRKTFMDR